MACFGEYWLEFQELTEMAVPSVVMNSLDSLFVVVDVAMLGHLGRGHIAALAIGNALFNIVWYFIEGFFTAQDTLSSIAFAQRDLKAVRYWTISSLISVILLCLIATTIFIFSSYILEDLLFIPPHMRSKAIVHVYILTPSIWFLSLFRVLQKFLSR
jgi:Na+-driven multidrug efflux pump